MTKQLLPNEVPTFIETVSTQVAKQLASLAREITMIECQEVSQTEHYEVKFLESGPMGRVILVKVETWIDQVGRFQLESSAQFFEA